MTQFGVGITSEFAPGNLTGGWIEGTGSGHVGRAAWARVGFHAGMRMGGDTRGGQRLRGRYQRRFEEPSAPLSLTDDLAIIANSPKLLPA
jgi:hypothetical protein